MRATKKFCSCTSKSNSVLEDCSSNSNVNRPSYFENLKNWVELVSPYDKRVVKEDDDKHLQLPFHSKEVNYDYQPKQPDSKQPTWPTKSGRTRAGVEAFCNTAIRNSTVGKVCSKIWKFPFDHYVQQCMDDIQVNELWKGNDMFSILLSNLDSNDQSKCKFFCFLFSFISLHCSL